MSLTVSKLQGRYGRYIFAALLGLTLACAGGQAFAQAPPAGGGQGNPGGPGGRGGFDPAQMRQRMLDALKEQLGAKDDEWKVLQPRIEKVLEAQQESMAGGMGGMFRLLFRGRGGAGGPPGGAFGGNANPSPLAKAAQDLQAATDDPNTDPKEYAKRMATYREARDKARANLAQAQKDLKDLLTAKQEALLLSYGMVD